MRSSIAFPTLLACLGLIAANQPAAGQCAETWLKGQGAPGPSFSAHAITFWDPDGDGPAPENIVVGGGGVVLAFDGNRWTTLGDEFKDSVEALTVFEGQLIAGGYFTDVGGVPLEHVARWNGNSWEPFGAISANRVNGFGTFGGELIAVSDAAGQVLQWDGTQWQLMGGGFPYNGLVNDIIELGGELFVCTSAGTVFRWDGVSWTQIGANFNASVNALAIHNGRLIAGGVFSTPARYIAQWNGSAWVALGGGLVPGVGVYDLDVFNGELIVAGVFTTPLMLPGSIATNLARWDGTAWHPLGGAPDQSVQLLAQSDGRLVVGGYFKKIGGIAADGLAQWNGTSWSAIPAIPRANPITGRVYVFGQYNGDLIAGGLFTKAGPITVDKIARWDGLEWHSLDVTFDEGDEIDALQQFGDDLIVGGNISSVNGDTTYNHIARWDGANWHSMGSGMDEYVHALTVYNGELLAGGYFHMAGGRVVNGIARWNGSEWLPMGDGVVGGVTSFLVHDGELFIAGFFTQVDGVLAKHVARWDGNAWHPIGLYLDSYANALSIYQDELYAAGGLTQPDGTIVPRISRFDGQNWSAVGAGGGTDQYSSVSRMLAHNGELFAVGYGDFLSGFADCGIARWNGSEWRDVGGGMGSPPGYKSFGFALTSYRDDLVAGGSFSTTGSIASSNWARWGYACCRGDYNADGTINLSDLGVLLSDYGCAGGNCPGDTDGDGDTDLSDLGTVLSAYGTMCN